LTERFGRLRFDDPKDLSDSSSILIVLVMQMRVLDFARRYHKRKTDKRSKRIEEEIKSLFKKISVYQTEMVRAFVTDELFYQYHQNDKMIYSQNQS